METAKFHKNSAKLNHHVVAVAYDGLRTFEFGCVVEFFAVERPELKTDWYRFSVCSAESRILHAVGGIEVRVANGLELLEVADTIVIPAWRNVNDQPPPALLSALRAAWQRGARLCSICSGVFVLAAAGVLKGKTVTSHWHHTRLLAQRYPEINVSNSALYIDEGQIITSAGSAAGLDMLLHLVKKDYGLRVANMVAERLVIPFLRAGGHSQKNNYRVVEKGENRIAALIDWLNLNFREHQSVPALAKRMMMSERTLQRHFYNVTGLPLMRWLALRRLECAKELLRATHYPIDKIAELSGHSSEATLRHQFRLYEHCSPSEYRQSRIISN
ncbi:MULTISPECIES: transcriptional regulator FtrA [unclassified Brenneria]|uniref:transcriptional regulator FtrA n=1 Tax=unclassified Brenneria TaxID=2634434 RepID=UPI0029C4222B|nr:MULTISPECIES: transcriptional regulator FtrA [unclassified Brenneria]MDX5627063.1 transcriptional regulator FtrA [Brenneria sp. L3-3Z]MDX5693587.1 transcriptional regulator FtrA [Brenneria sp. L4-2C]MEE3663542.1 transcriptional regulator FtrA [Brenneria sp. g21c3]